MGVRGIRDALNGGVESFCDSDDGPSTGPEDSRNCARSGCIESITAGADLGAGRVGGGINAPADGGDIGVVGGTADAETAMGGCRGGGSGQKVSSHSSSGNVDDHGSASACGAEPIFMLDCVTKCHSGSVLVVVREADIVVWVG